MNQNSLVVRLRDVTQTGLPFGNTEGRATYQKLLSTVEANPAVRIVGISFEDIEATDASFPRESVVSLAKHLRGQVGVYLQDISDRDLIDNWDYAAKAKEQPLTIWKRDGFEMIGPTMTSSTRELVDYVLTRGVVVASQVAADLDISVPNASTRLKNLVSQGYLLRAEDVAASGGIEFKYLAIK